jgi:hypothetical protein|nr:MAG TPA: hypothetical protein [Caudoviricetes sp.]
MRTNNKEEQSYYKKPCSFLLWGALGVYMKSEKMPHLAPQISTKIKKAVCII